MDMEQALPEWSLSINELDEYTLGQSLSNGLRKRIDILWSDIFLCRVIASLASRRNITASSIHEGDGRTVET